MTGINAAAAGTFLLAGETEIVRMGYGAMRLTGEGIWGAPKDIPNALAVLRRALELGVNFIDTSDAYGPDVNEDLIAQALHPYPPGLIIATKGGLTRSGPGKWHPVGTPQHLRSALEGSLKRLKVDTIDLYQFHRPDPAVPFEDSVGEFAKMRQEGKVRYVGLSNVNVEQLEQAMAIVPIVTVQNRYNFNDRDSEAVLKLCEQHKIGFIPWYPVGGGNVDALPAQIAAKYNASTYQIALAWLLRHSRVMLPIPGTSSVGHLEENIAAAGLLLSEEDYQALSTLKAA